jgi:phosphohistidine phosphatase
MVELILIRHANAGAYLEPDIERHLSEIGKLEAQQTAQVLKYSGHVAGTWLCSTANRTFETVKIIQDIVPELFNSLILEENWYRTTGKQYLEKIEQQKEPTLFLVAHNPSISYVASYFTNQNIHMETAEVIHLRWNFADNWKETSANSAEIIYQFNPKIQSYES